MIRLLVAALLALIPAAAHAEWRRAESKNFIVYSEQSEPELRDAITRMEKFAFIVSQPALTGRQITPTPVKMKVYIVRSLTDLQETLPFGGFGVAGYYNPSIRGSFIVTPRQAGRGQFMSTRRTIREEQRDFSEIAFYHELTHHFMFQYQNAAYPTWYSEGFADFFGTFQIDDDNKLLLGAPQTNRLRAIEVLGWLPVEKLLTARSYADLGDQIGSLYAQGWLLVHYGFTNPERGRQTTRYLTLIQQGKSYADAAREAYGDLDALNRELQAYSRRPRMDQIGMTLRPIDVGNIEIRTLSAAESDLWRYDLSLSGGVARSEADSFVNRVRAIVARHPNDAYALRILTEAEEFTGNTAQAQAALDRWMALEPQSPLALMYKGKLAVERLVASRSTDDAAWDAARQPLIEANRLAPNEPRVLQAYYESFSKRGELPPAGAQAGLFRALQLVPSEGDLRYQVAADFEKRGMIREALAVIRPLAFTQRPDSELSPAEKARREKDKVRYAMVGQDIERETPREMMDRLEKKLAEGTTTAAAQ